MSKSPGQQTMEKEEMSPARTGRWGASWRAFPQGQVLRAGEGQGKKGEKGEKGEKRKRGFTWSSNFMGHIGKEFGFRSVGEFGGLPSCRVSLDRISQVEDHLVNLALQLVHFSRRLHGDQFCKVSISCSISYIAKSADLSRQVHSHCVDV